jgi:protein O-GlcNAc transferase
LEAHLGRFKLADLFLDTLPVNAHTTASDVLWAGVPVITCPGHSFVSRVAGSLLQTIGLPELIARDLAGYERIALDLALHPARLTLLREKLVANRHQSGLFDATLVARHLESAYRQMWKRYMGNESPAPFAVAASDLPA